MKIKKIIAAAACVTAITSMTLFSIGCDPKPKQEKDGFDIEVATPVNTDKYDIPQDYCRTYYEVFVRSFADGNGDGIGDLRGLIEGLDYLNDGDDTTTSDLGINGIWMMPIHSSPSYHKYDVIDYYSIDKEYGTMSDFEDLVAACAERDIWLQMDLVLNHTSSQHEWFKRAVADAKLGLEPSESSAMRKYSFVQASAKPQGNWYEATNGYWYLGNFSKEMPDLDLSNTEVREEIKNIVDFWLTKGVRSFRLDAVPWAYADSVAYTEANGEFWTWFNDYCHTKGAEVAEKQGWSNSEIGSYCYNVGEVLEFDGSVVQRFFDTGMSNFNFAYSGADTTSGYLNVISKAAKSGAAGFVMNLSDTQKDSLERDADALLSNMISNHDMDRWAAAPQVSSSEFKKKKAAGLYLLIPGNPYIYYGEEIGARGSRGGNNSDANRRLHFNWGDDRDVNDPPESNYSGTQKFGSVVDQTGDKDSILTYYRQAIKLRNRFPEIGRGKMTAYAINADGKLVKASELGVSTGFPNINVLNKTVAAYTLGYKGENTLIVQNIDDADAAIDFSSFDGYEVVGAVKANGGRVVVKDGKLYISGGIAAVIKKKTAQ